MPTATLPSLRAEGRLARAEINLRLARADIETAERAYLNGGSAAPLIHATSRLATALIERARCRRRAIEHTA